MIIYIRTVPIFHVAWPLPVVQIATHRHYVFFSLTEVSDNQWDQIQRRLINHRLQVYYINQRPSSSKLKTVRRVIKIIFYVFRNLHITRHSNKLLEQGYVKERLKSSPRKFYGRYADLIKQYEVSISQMLNDILWPDHIQWQPLLIRLCTDLDLYWILRGFHRTFATGVACRHRTLTPLDTCSRPFGTCICSTCWGQSFFRTCRYFYGLCSSNNPR